MAVSTAISPVLLFRTTLNPPEAIQSSVLLAAVKTSKPAKVPLKAQREVQCPRDDAWRAVCIQSGLNSLSCWDLHAYRSAGGNERAVGWYCDVQVRVLARLSWDVVAGLLEGIALG